jgi:hypothetical protein
MTPVEPGDYRFGCFIDLGFNNQQADVLAWSKDDKDVFLYHGDVAKTISKMREKGKSEEDALLLAFDLYANA